ncbi:hypothetical protein DCAR_0727269 [Daucus carota subsp. sativus]|uniref:Uncharacterized protein n=1 Tax=Daucus carota subsp. sativus TaxID=79200 RepID=A0A161Y3A9_DAUCS|nr:hypothetical protein DCAR_0727269 [Daucus carota subsp. sativus]
MNAEELRNLAGGLEIKLDRMKKRRELMMRNKRLKTAIQCNDGCNLDMDEAVVDVAMNLIEDDVSCDLDMSPLPDEAIVRDQFEMAMNSVEDNVSCNFGMTPMPVGAVVWDQLEMAMNSIEDNVSCNLDMNPMAMNSIEDNVSYNLDMNPMPGEAIVRDQLILIEDNMGCNLQPNAMKKVDDVNGMTLPNFGDNLTDLQQQCLYDPSNLFVKDGSGAHIEADLFSDSFLMSPAVMSADEWGTCGYDSNAFDFSLSDCFPMHEASACGNSQLVNCVPRQSFDWPPLPPLML